MRISDWSSDVCSSDLIVIEITDDGRGIDTDRLVEKAISAKIITKEKAAALTEEGRLNLIFAPGLSTARQITSVSGRGVGMDVVQSNIERIGGLLSLAHRHGRGLSIILRVDRKSVVEGTSVSMSVGSGGCREIDQKKK